MIKREYVSKIASLSFAFLFILLFTNLSATPIRVIVLNKLTVEGKKTDSSDLESAAYNELGKHKMEMIELSAALDAQKNALSRSVEKGIIPKELSVLSADAVVSHSLRCKKSSANVFGSGVGSYACTLLTKVIRIDTGKIVFTKSDHFSTYGTNESLALQFVINEEVAPRIGAHTGKWKKSWGDDSDWRLDLFVSGISDNTAAIDTVDYLKKLSEVESSRVISYSRELSKIALSGRGGENLKNLKKALERDKKLQLRVTYDGGSIVHAKFDVESMFRKDVEIYLSVGENENTKTLTDVVKTNAPDMLYSYFLNLGYFNVTKTEVMPGKIKNITLGAKKRGVKFVIHNSIFFDGNKWRNSAKLIKVDKGTVLISASGDGENPFSALESSVRNLDTQYKKSVDKPFFRSEMGFSDELPKVIIDPLTVQNFKAGEIYPSLLPYYRKNGIGSLEIVNSSSGKMKDIEITFRIGSKVSSMIKVPELIPGKNRTVQIIPDIIPHDTAYSQLKAVIVYKTEASYGKKEVYAPLIIHKQNAINWKNPESLVSFIDSGNNIIRGLATKAISFSEDKKNVVTKKLTDAAMIYSAIWSGNFKYVDDPVHTSFTDSFDTVSYPVDTLNQMSGDCDDLTVLLASFFESVGIATAVIITPGHVLLGVESGALAGGHILFDLPESMFVEVDGALFIPIETTIPGKNFGDAWLKGANAVKEAGKDLYSFRVRQAWKTYPPTGTQKGVTIPEINRPDIKVISDIIPFVRKNSGAADKKDKSNPLASSVKKWMDGKIEEAIDESFTLCEKGIEEACYNGAVMLISVKREIDTEKIIAALPPRVVQMLLDQGSYGLSAQAEITSTMKKRVSHSLKIARMKDKKKEIEKALVNRKKTVKKRLPLSGRKGALKDKISPFIFFWGEIEQ